jgi:hypothetical protein
VARAPFTSRSHAGAIGEQRGSIDGQPPISASLACASCVSASVPPNIARFRARSSASCAARLAKPSAAARDGRAKDVERAERELHAVALGPEQRVLRHATCSKLDARERMRRDDFDALGDGQSRHCRRAR